MNIRNAAFISSIKVDQILGTFSGSFVSPAPTFSGFSTTVFNTFATNITNSTFFQGIYSIDGGTTWNDFCNEQLVLPPGVLFPYLAVIGKSKNNSFTVRADNYWNDNTNSGSAYTVLYKVALIAQPNQGTVTPQPIGTNVFLDSRNNYQKIFVDDVRPVSLASFGTGTVTITHNLGYEPKIRPFFYLNSDASMNELGNSYLGVPDISINISTIAITLNAPFGGLVGSLMTRVYYDN